MQPFVSKIVNGKAIGLTNIPDNMSQNQKQSVEGSGFEKLLALVREGHEATINEEDVEEYYDKLRAFLSQQQLEVVEKTHKELLGEVEMLEKYANWTHRVGSHSDDYGGESDLTCDCDNEERRIKLETLNSVKIRINKLLQSLSTLTTLNNK